MSIARLPGWAQTIRFRLAATYSVVLFALTTAVLGLVYAVVSRTVDAAPLNPVTVQKVQWTGGRLVLRNGGEFQAADLASVQQAVNYQTLQTLRDVSVVVLAGLLVLSFAVGWLLAGRVLRPVRRVTAAAQEIGATDLSRRIALDGPRDELRTLADTLDAMLARLDGAFTAQRALIDDASHELRNPLAVIRTTVDAVLSCDDVAPDERRRAAAVVSRATARMAGLIEDLLASARRAAPAFTEADLDLSAAVAEATDEYELLAGDRHLDRRLDAGLVVIGDGDAVRRAVGNLLSNALRVTAAGGTVTVATGRRQGWAFVAVRDEGPGVDPDDQDRVFDRFWRGSADRDAGHRAGGTGLGLAIVRQVVESHGGSVALHSRPGSGATFVLWLPLRPEDATGRSPRPPQADPVGRPAPRAEHLPAG